MACGYLNTLQHLMSNSYEKDVFYHCPGKENIKKKYSSHERINGLLLTLGN